MIFVNTMTNADNVPHDVLERFVQLLAPYAPHLAEEIWEQLGHTNSIFESEWPSYDSSLAHDLKIQMPVQINGKVRVTLEVDADISEREAVELALADTDVQRYVEGKELKKVVFVKGRLLSIVL
jgi:leucyl-tRNA synthetase